MGTPKVENVEKIRPDLRKYGTYLLNKKQRPELYNVRTGLSSVVMHPVMQRFQHALETNSGSGANADSRPTTNSVKEKLSNTWERSSSCSESFKENRKVNKTPSSK